jgi:hypothetical protein
MDSVTSIIRVMMCATLGDDDTRPATRAGSKGDRVEPNEIFELIIKADERIKYAKPGKGDLRAGQARELLEQARDAAREIGNDALVTQAETRLSDLEALAAGDAPG